LIADLIRLKKTTLKGLLSLIITTIRSNDVIKDKIADYENSGAVGVGDGSGWLDVGEEE
jgi:hypothetical protein